ncbi:MAG: ABC transporter ATP-binding protein [Bacteroidota bacterium]
MADQYAIYCRGLRAGYGRREVLNGIDLQVPRGVIYALLGTNGAGKTTFIRTMLGLMPRAAGEAGVLGEDPWQAGPALRQRVGYVSEEQGLYGWMRVEQLVGFCRGLYDHWNRDLVAGYLERFDLAPKTRIGAMSKGQKVRLALILALAPEPQLLILDEPMNGLDPLAQHEFLQIIREDAAQRSRTIFFSTHNLADVEAVATHVAILHGGTVKAAGEIGAVCDTVRRVSAPKDLRLEAAGAMLLQEDAASRTYLVPGPGAGGKEAAAAGETPAIAGSPATLEEVFLFHCAGRGKDAGRQSAAR